MKKIQILIASFLLLAATSCRPDIPQFKYLQEKSIASISGQWKGVSVVQRDRDAERKKFPYQSKDITAFVKFSEFRLTLNNNDGKPGTFTINYGNSLPLFKFNSGNWIANNNDQVTEVKLVNGTDTAVLNLSPFSNLREQRAVFQYTKKLGNTPAITYELTLSK